MKLATYRDGSRDGQLVVVSRDLTMAHYATHAAHTLQHVLDDWNFISPQLQDLYVELNHGKGRHVFPFDPGLCMAPLPRAFQCVRGAAYAALPRLLARAIEVAEWPEAQRTAGWMQLSGDAFQGASDELVWAEAALQLDFEAGWAAITSDVPAGCAPERALEGVRMLALTNTWALRGPTDAALDVAYSSQTGDLAALRSRPAVSFTPVAVTPDELGDAWLRGRIHAALQTSVNGRRVGLTDAGADMNLHMGQLLALVGAHRPLRAGTVVCTGPVCSPGNGDGPDARSPNGHHCLLARRAMEVLQTGQPATPYLSSGDCVRIEMTGRDGVTVFGAIDQTVHLTDT